LKGDRLAELRKDHGMKQQELAVLLSVSVTTVSGYENDQNTPCDATKVKIAKIFNVSLDYLLGAIDHQISLDRSEALLCPRVLPTKAKVALETLIHHMSHVSSLERETNQ